MALSPPDASYVPFLPPLDPYVMPPAAYDQLIAAFGIRLTWQKAHLCPCVYSGQETGSPDPSCITCGGRAYYWDAPSAIFNGLISYMHLSPSPDEPGAVMDEKFGLIERSEPILTIPYNATGIYGNASLNDVFVEVDAIDRYQAQLQLGGIISLPYQWNTNVAASGAVTVWNPSTSGISFVSGYTVSGAIVTLPSGYANGQSYVVEYYASRAWAAWRNAGSTPHDRPFAQTSQPQRFRLQQLDLWLRGSGKI